MSSINNSAAVSDKFRLKYGNTWADMDFITEKLNFRVFKIQPMDYDVGTLYIANQKIKFEFKDLFRYETEINNMLPIIYSSKTENTFLIDIKGQEFQLQKHEVSRLYETIRDAKITIYSKYELGI
jgi:hypothetical protein